MATHRAEETGKINLPTTSVNVLLDTLTNEWWSSIIHLETLCLR